MCTLIIATFLAFFFLKVLLWREKYKSNVVTFSLALPNRPGILVRAVNRRSPPQIPGIFRRFRNQCDTCPFIKEGTTFHTFFSTGENRQIRHRVCCTTTNVIYMMQCHTPYAVHRWDKTTIQRSIWGIEIRKARESYLHTLANTLQPNDINRRDKI